MKKITNILLRRIDIHLAIACLMSFTIIGAAWASGTSTFNQVISGGTLAVDIVDNSYVTVGSPSITMGAKTFSYTCQTGGSAASGTFGASGQNIYVQNPDADDSGWSIALAASATTASWTASTIHYDFNDGGGSGCTDGADADAYKGQMTVDPSVGTLAVGQCASCTTTSITKGSSTAYVEGTTDSVTLLTAAAGSDDVGDWKFTGVSVKNTIPAEQAAASYAVNMVLSITGA